MLESQKVIGETLEHWAGSIHVLALGLEEELGHPEKTRSIFREKRFRCFKT